MPGVGKKADAVADRSGVPLLYNHACLYRSLPPGGKGGTPFPALVPGAGTLPVGFQGRSALVAPKGAKSLLLLFDVDAVGAQIAFEFGDVDQVEMEDGGG